MPRQRVTSQVTSLASCVGGWNSRDPIANMPQEDAVTLINMFPTPGDVRLRLGWASQGTLTGGIVRTIATYAGGNVQKLFAINQQGIWDCSTAGAPVLQTTLFTIADPAFEWVMISNAGGNFLVMVNGTDPMTVYDGTSWWQVAAPTVVAQTISSAVASTNILNIVTSTAHGLVDGNRVTLAGFTPATYNGSYVVDVQTSTAFRITLPSALGTVTTTGTYTPSVITGYDSRTFYNVNLFKNRLWFAIENTLTAVYLDTQAILGAASPFPLGAFFGGGGFIQAIGTWTLDAGQGVDDLLVFVASSGEILVYQGTDPTNAQSFAMKGLWQLGTVFTKRCFQKWGGDLLLLTHEGLTPLAQALQSSRLDPRVNVTDKIYFAISQATDAYQDNFGWQIAYFGRQNMLIINVPVTGGIEQYVMHTISKAWCRFRNIEAYCFTIFRDNLYFGGNNVVGQYYEGNSDNGNNISAQVQQAFSYFGKPGQLKRFTLLRPVFLTDVAAPGITVGLNFDFAVQNTLGQPQFDPTLALVGQWDVSLWDSSATWSSGDYIVSTVWQDVGGIGTSAGISMNLVNQGSNIRWVSSDLVFEPGGVL